MLLARILVWMDVSFLSFRRAVNGYIDHSRVTLHVEQSCMHGNENSRDFSIVFPFFSHQTRDACLVILLTYYISQYYYQVLRVDYYCEQEDGAMMEPIYTYIYGKHQLAWLLVL